MSAILKDLTLRLTGSVGEFFFEDGFTTDDVVLALGQIDDAAHLTVHLNSPGGDASEGAAIHALLSARSGPTDIVIEGIAASAASLIAMAGGNVTMAAGAVMMIHDPSGQTWGNSADHSKSIEALEALATAYARVYAAKSGKSADECRQIMKDERWYSPQEAVDAGFADETTEGKATPVAAFDYRLFAHAPKRLTALAKKQNWSMSNNSAPPPKSQPKKGTAMNDKTMADARLAASARIKNILTCDEADGRKELSEHLAFDTDMTAEAAIALLAKAPDGSGAMELEGARYLEAKYATPDGKLNGEGLNRYGTRDRSSGKTGRVDLVATMKRRHGVS